MRRLLGLAGTIVALGVSPAAVHAGTNCCFEMAADVEQSAAVDYGHDESTFYNGAYKLERFWSIRSIVAFHETAFRHRPVLKDKATEGRLITAESESLTQRTARKDDAGHYIRDPLKCKGDPFQGGDSDLAPVRGAVALPHEPSGYRLRLDGGPLFNAEAPRCPGGADFSLHRNLSADSPAFQVVPPKRGFLRSANGGDHVRRTFHFGPFSATHANVAGPHTFTGEATLTIRFRWFPKSELRPEKRRLEGVKCPADLKCEDDRWGK